MELMAQTVLLEHTKEADLKWKSRNLSFSTMGKSQKFSKYASGFVPDYRHAVETIGETEGFGSSGRVDSEDSCAPKRKSISLNVAKHGGFNIQTHVFPVLKMSASEKRELESRLRSELEEIQTFQKKVLSRSMAGVNSIALSSSSDGHAKKSDPVRQNGTNLKCGALGRSESLRQAPPPSATNSYAKIFKQCQPLLRNLMKHKYGWVFNFPVDVVKLNIPDYHNVIRSPMDLGTVKTKLSKGVYSTPSDFVADVRLTFTNAMTYNPPGNDVHTMADIMSKVFEAGWKKLTGEHAGLRRKAEEVKAAPHPKKRKASPIAVPKPEIVKPKMSIEDRCTLSRELEPMLSDLPDHIIDFLRRHSGNSHREDEIEIDIDILTDETLFELRKLLDDFLREGHRRQQPMPEPSEVEILNVSGISNSSLNLNQGHELAEEDVDIGGNDPPMSIYPPMEIEKDATLRSSKGGSASSSSSHSGSSSSDSDTGSSSGSESDVRASTPKKENSGSGTTFDQEKGRNRNLLDKNRSVGVSDQSGQDLRSKSLSLDENGCKEGENAPSERQVSPDKLYRAAVLKGRFADTILKAREKTLDQVGKSDPEKLQQEREELERQQRQERARLQAEAKAAEDARKRAEAEAAAEAKRKRELEREAARQALMKMEKTVEMNENTLVFKDLEILRSAVPAEQVPSSVDETSPDHSPDGMSGFKLGVTNPLEQLGLYMKADDDDEEDDRDGDDDPKINPSTKDVEEGEID